jgi:hypothetical protein
MESKQQILTKVYEAFNRREIDAILGWMRPDVDWPNGMEGGRVHGHGEVRDYWRRQWTTVNPHVEPVRMEDNADGKTVVNVHQVVRNLAGEVLMDRMVEHVYSIEDGLIERMDIVEPDLPAGQEHAVLESTK